MGENYIKRLKIIDHYIKKGIEGCEKSTSFLSEAVKKGASIDNSVIAENTERLKNLIEFQNELYMIFPEMEDFTKVSKKNVSSDFDKYMVE